MKKTELEDLVGHLVARISLLEMEVEDLADVAEAPTLDDDFADQASIVLATKTEPYALANTATLYVSGDTLLDVAQSLVRAVSDLGGAATFLTLSVDFIPAGDDGEPAYFAGTVTTGE